MNKSLKQDIKNVTYQACGVAAKAVFRGNCIGLDSYFRKEEKLKTSNLSFHFKKLEKK